MVRERGFDCCDVGPGTSHLMLEHTNISFGVPDIGINLGQQLVLLSQEFCMFLKRRIYLILSSLNGELDRLGLLLLQYAHILFELLELFACWLVHAWCPS